MQHKFVTISHHITTYSNPMNNKKYDLSVITVCKNAIQDIKSTIESVAKIKDILNIEHIVIDGLSTDGTANILKNLLLSNSIDIYISEEDKGIYDAMNKGIKISSGKILYFLNSGDKLYDINTLELAINGFNQHPNIDFIYFDHIGINSDGSAGYSKKPTRLSIEYFDKTNLCHQAIFYRKDCFKKIGLFDTTYRFLADFDWNLRAFFQHDIKAAYIPHPACFFDNCGIHTHEKYREIVREERRKALSCNTAGKENLSFHAKLLPASITTRRKPPLNNANENPRVIFVAYGPNQLNGPNIWLQRLLPELIKRNVSPEVIFLLTRNNKCDVISSLQDKNITCFPLLLSPYTENNIINILQVVKDRAPDIFVPNLSVAAYYAAKWMKSSGIPTVGVIHSDDTFHHEIIDTFIGGDSGDVLSGAICVSNFLRNIAQQNNKHDIPIMTNPCGVPRSKNLALKPENEFRIIYTGRLIQRQKRIFDVIAACHAASNLIKDTYFSFYGEDRENGRAIASIQTCLNRNFLKYGGKLRLEEIYPTLSKHHAFILLSDYEGMSISLMEAMACGLVPICTRTKSGSTEIIRHNENGLLVDNRDGDFLNAVRRLKTEKGLWERLSKGARETIEKKYSIDICADKWTDFLRCLISKSSGKKTIHIPELNEIKLPPVKQTENGMCREDKRMPRVHSNSTLRPEQHDNFLNSQLAPDFVDLYIVRTAIKKALDNHLPLFHGTLIDVGCGQMPYREYILTSQPLIEKYIGLDFAQGKYADLKKPDLTWNGTTIPLKDASVDCAMATEVLEHCHDPLITLKEIRRVLKPDGAFFITVPFLWPLHDTPHDHYRYTPFSLARLLAEAGFEDVEINALGGWNASLAQMIGLWLKRAPMPDEMRQQMVSQLFPLYKQLVVLDTHNALPQHEDNAISPGWSGIAYRAFNKKTENPIPNYLTSHNICIIRNEHFAYSQTFIEDHIAFIAEKPNVIHGELFPMFNQNKQCILNEKICISIGNSNNKISHIEYTEALSSYFKKNNIDVVLAEFGIVGAKIFKACEKAGIPYVVHFHGYDATATPTLQMYQNEYRMFFKSASGLVVVSKAMRDKLISIGAPAGKVILNPYGVDVSREDQATPETSSPIFLAVGRFVEKKAPHLTIQAFEKTAKLIPAARLVMVGDGPLLKPCQELADKLNIRSQVIFSGVHSRRSVAKLMRFSRAFVQHSVTAANGDTEGLPLAVLEAGASGLPVISTRHAGIPDAVIEGENGFLVDEGDVQKMSEAMLRIAKNPKIAGWMGKNYQLRVFEKFSREKSILGLQNILSNVAQKNIKN